MLCNIKATYEKGVLRTDHPLDLPDGTQVVLSVRTSSDHETPPLDRGKIRDALAAAGLVEKESPKKTTKPIRLSLAERKRLGRLFAGEPSLSEIILSERDGK